VSGSKCGKKECRKPVQLVQPSDDPLTVYL